MQSALEQRQIAELKEAFHYMDHDGDGVIDEKDLEELLPSLGIIYRIIETYHRVGLQMSGRQLLEGIKSKLNFPMFLSIITDINNESQLLSKQLLESFEILDEDGTGNVRMSTLEDATPGLADQVQLLFSLTP
jgi:Ca2+-binding EF-hand superfamily protein